MDEHQPTTTTHHDLINLLLQDGLGEGLPKIAELLTTVGQAFYRPFSRMAVAEGL